MAKKYLVTLQERERESLRELIGKGHESARKITRARILLKADENSEGWSDPEIARALEVARATVERVRKRFAREGMNAALEQRPQPARPEKRVLDQQKEAELLALAGSRPQEGQARWTLEALAAEMVKSRRVLQVSRDTVRRVLKKAQVELRAEE